MAYDRLSPHNVRAIEPLMEINERAKERIKAGEEEARQQLNKVIQACDADVATAQRMFGGYFELHGEQLREAIETARQRVAEARLLCSEYVFVAHANEYLAIVRDPKERETVLAMLRGSIVQQFGEDVRGAIEAKEAKMLLATAEETRSHANDSRAAESVAPQLADRSANDDVMVGEERGASEPSDEASPANDQVRRRRTPDLDSSRERLALVGALARELAIIKQEVKGYCTVDGLKRKHPKFTLWTVIEDSQIRALVDGEEFTPKAYAENLTLAKFGLTSRETLKKDRKKLRKAKEAGQQ